MNCTTCNQTINRPPSQLKGKNNFCNHSCYSKFKAIKWTKEKNPNWVGGLGKLKCRTCFKEFTRRNYRKSDTTYCSVKCAEKNRGLKIRGERHWNWKGGDSTRYMRKIAPRPKPNKCEICNSPSSNFKKGLQYDHDHKTKKFRGWLCPNCNTALGLVKENIVTLKSLIHYIKVNENLF